MDGCPVTEECAREGCCCHSGFGRSPDDCQLRRKRLDSASHAHTYADCNSQPYRDANSSCTNANAESYSHSQWSNTCGHLQIHCDGNCSRSNAHIFAIANGAMR